MQIENAIKDEFVTEYIPDEFQVKSFYLPEPLVKHEVGELTEPVTRSEERSQFGFQLAETLHRICNADMSPEAL
jgi:hypothetical protein